ncbi:MAG: hypothetical protein UY56_C0005G0046 [Parcubacteria group bacterium GW2011_GWA1_50_14]|uniref:Uncharacterized protein n=1 Tax=Candidatus Liptonbacteria bacterium GWB1_49_6 TaxID=1798644 RepID=A0A1G2C4Y9_9BACT|nr:MAG: hypothetical protein UY56_C0005G0046 [Parcubacteria group bacterium GW2011_GWA1_50_14]OGY96482.1 MAG: hypothetical protein A2122_02180 [Candidatus Liptonbacteria bacterium GWB1_49_6]
MPRRKGAKEIKKIAKLFGITEEAVKRGMGLLGEIRYDEPKRPLKSGTEKFVMCKISKPFGIYEGLTKEDKEKILDYMITETLPDGTKIQSYRTAVKRLKFAKRLEQQSKKAQEG